MVLAPLGLAQLQQSLQGEIDPPLGFLHLPDVLLDVAAALGLAPHAAGGRILNLFWGMTGSALDRETLGIVLNLCEEVVGIVINLG